jgi:hypothetical protein
MAAPLREPKTLPEWIELDYYCRPRRLRRVRRLLNWACFLMGAALIALTFWQGKTTLYQAGPLSTAHTMFNSDCGTCHTGAFQSARRFLPTQAALCSVHDETCNLCHHGAMHQEQQISAPACASCHQEHRGRQLLGRVADRFCTACHADLHRKDGQPTLENVSDFARTHPEFALWRNNEQDPGQVRFNHQVHLREVGVIGPDRKLTRLECVACHQVDTQRSYMLPIRYDQHCASCHPLWVNVIGPGPTNETHQAVLQFAREPAPHPRQGSREVRAALRDRLTELVRRYPVLRDTSEAPAGDRSVPGPPPIQPAASLDEGAWVDRQLRHNERMFFETGAGCAYCHFPRAPKGSPAASRDLPDYLPTAIRTRWLSKSGFSHDRHRMMDCAACHPAATSARTSDILMPRIDTCHQCHKAPTEGARSDCVECHGYHDRTREKFQGRRLAHGS